MKKDLITTVAIAAASAALATLAQHLAQDKDDAQD